MTTPAPHIQKKNDVRARNPDMGMPREWYGADGLIDTSMRGHILNDVHRAHTAYMNSLRNEGRDVPQFLTRDVVDGLLGVEGFLIPKKKLASYNVPSQASYTGVLQFGSAAYHTHAKTIAQRLNTMMQDPAMADTSLARMINDGRVTFPFDKDNVWEVHRNPVAQMVGTAIHTAATHPKIDKLISDGRISKDEARGLFVIAHNIPALSNLVMANLEQGTDPLVQSPQVARYKDLMATNPALYQDTQSLRGILDKVSQYAALKAKGMESLSAGAAPHIAHTRPALGHGNDSRQQLTEFIKNILEQEARKANTAESDREKLNAMIRSITEQPQESPGPAAAPQLIAAKPEPLPKRAVQATPRLPVAQPAAPKIAAVPKPKVKVNDAYQPSTIASSLNGQHRKLSAPQMTAQQIDDEEKRMIKPGAVQRQPQPPKASRMITNSTVTG